MPRTGRVSQGSSLSPTQPASPTRSMLSSTSAIDVSSAAPNEQNDARHVGNDQRRACEDGHVPLRCHVRDRPCRRSMRKSNEEVEQPDQRARPCETPSPAPTPAQAQKGGGCK